MQPKTIQDQVLNGSPCEREATSNNRLGSRSLQQRECPSIAIGLRSVHTYYRKNVQLQDTGLAHRDTSRQRG
jgi:hypothetical protein